MVVQPKHRFSVKEYYRMAETGVLRPNARVELLNGEITDMSPIGPFHGGLVKRLSRIFNLKAKGRWIVSTQDPLHLDDHSEPEPDVMLLKPAPDDYTSRHPQANDVFLLIEVSDSTLEYDRTEKLSAYGRAGVAEVWIVLAKFFAAYLLVIGIYASSSLFAAVLGRYGDPDWGPIVSGYLALALLAALLVAIGLLMSSLTENQVVAATASIGMFLMLWFSDSVSYMLPQPFESLALNLSLIGHFKPIATGSLFLSDAGYFVTGTLLALYFATRRLAER